MVAQMALSNGVILRCRLPDDPPINIVPEAPRDPKLGDIGGEPGFLPGEEDWRDGRTDDGEQDSDDALDDAPETDDEP